MLYFFKNKIKKNSWRYYCFTPVYQKSWWYDLQFLRYRVWQTEIGHYELFLALLPTPSPLSRFLKTQNQNTIIIWGTDLTYGVRQTKFLVILNFGPFFCPFIVCSNNPENQNFEKMKKASGDAISLHMCTKNHDHMMYASWDMECDKHNFLSFWPS